MSWCMKPSWTLIATLAKYPVAGAAYLSLWSLILVNIWNKKKGTADSCCVWYKLILVVCIQSKFYRLLVSSLIEICFQTFKAADEMWRICHPELGYNQHAQSFLVSALSSHLKWLRNAKPKSLIKSNKNWISLVCVCLAPTVLMDLPLCSPRVIFRGLLLGLSTLYQQILLLLREVANSRPMPFLTDFSLPADMTQFLGPSETSLLKKLAGHIPLARDSKEEQGKRRETSSIKVKKQRQTRGLKEDLGVALERG